jgi:Uncharacterized membrane-associated protein
MLLYFAPSEALVPASIAVLGPDIHTAAAAVGVSVLGTSLGQLALFYGLRTKGKSLIDRRWLPEFTGEKAEKCSDAFEKYGSLAVLISNFLPFLRGTMTFPAGLSTYRMDKFALFSAMGSIVFQSALALAAMNVLSF